jgi:hypothetical protein
VLLEQIKKLDNKFTIVDKEVCLFFYHTLATRRLSLRRAASSPMTPPPAGESTCEIGRIIGRKEGSWSQAFFEAEVARFGDGGVNGDV